MAGADGSFVEAVAGGGVGLAEEAVEVVETEIIYLHFFIYNTGIPIRCIISEMFFTHLKI